MTPVLDLFVGDSSDGIDQWLQTGGSAREAARQRDEHAGVVDTAGDVVGGDPREVPAVLSARTLSTKARIQCFRTLTIITS